MHVLPDIAPAPRAHVGEIGTRALGAQQLRRLIGEIPASRGPAEYFVLCERSDLLRVAVAAPVGGVDGTSLRLERSQRLHTLSRRRLRELHAGKDAHQQSERDIDECRAAGDYPQLPHVPPSTTGAVGVTKLSVGRRSVIS